MKGTKDLSVVVPVYRDLATLSTLANQFLFLAKNELGFKIEIIFVNDGNCNNPVYEELVRLSKEPNIRVIHLSRNFGQHVALAAGIKNAFGDFVLCLDSDLQYSSSECFEMYKWAKANGYSAVVSTINSRMHSISAKLFAKIYYTFMISILGAPYRTNLGSVFLISRHVARGLSRLNDRSRLTIPMVYWLVGDIRYYEVTHQSRSDGESNYNFTKLVKHALDGITTFSARPLYLSLYLSFFFISSSIAVIVYLMLERIVMGAAYLPGWLSTVLIVLVSSSFVLFCLGIVGLYLARVFEAVSGRPLYFVQDQSNEVKLFEEHE